MAKNRIIQLPDGVDQTDDALAEQIVEAEAPTMTFGALVAAILAIAATAKKVLVNTATNKVFVAANTNDDIDAAAVVGTTAANGGRFCELTRDDPDSRVSAWTVTNLGGNTAEGTALRTAIAALCAAQKPQRSVSSMISAIEDAAAQLETPITIVVDQSDEGTLRLSTVVNEPDAADVEAVIEGQPPSPADETPVLPFE